MHITVQQLVTLDAVVSQGGFQAGALFLNKTHPSVIAALKKLEEELGFNLFDRSGYRSVLTEQGRQFYDYSQRLLGELSALKEYATHIREGEAVEMNMVLGDVTPIDHALGIVRRFTEQHTSVRLNLLFENLTGPNERLLDGEADLIVHHIDKSDPRYEYKAFCQVAIVPVAAPGFLRCPLTRSLRYADLKDYTQCVIRDTAQGENKQNYFVLPDSPQITVGDQYTKKEIILQRMGWGHMPMFLIEDELSTGQLVSIEGDHIKGNRVDIVIARLGAGQHSQMAERLWRMFDPI